MTATDYKTGSQGSFLFAKRQYGGQAACFFAALARFYSSREISGMVTRQNRLERKTLLEGNSVLPP